MSRRFRRRPSRRSLFAAALLLITLVRYGWDQSQRHPQSKRVPLVEGPCTVVRVLDGDTLIVRQNSDFDEQAVRLRLLGINCPESAPSRRHTEPWSARAARFTRDFVTEGDVRLRLDRRRLDQHDRCLAYLLVNGRMLNLELVRAGLARVHTYPGDSPSIARQLRHAEREAKANLRGLWSRSPDSQQD